MGQSQRDKQQPCLRCQSPSGPGWSNDHGLHRWLERGLLAYGCQSCAQRSPSSIRLGLWKAADIYGCLWACLLCCDVTGREDSTEVSGYMTQSGSTKISEKKQRKRKREGAEKGCEKWSNSDYVHQGDKEPSRTRPDHRRRGTRLNLKVAVTHKEDYRWGRTRFRRCEEGCSPEMWRMWSLAKVRSQAIGWDWGATAE